MQSNRVDILDYCSGNGISTSGDIDHPLHGYMWFVFKYLFNSHEYMYILLAKTCMGNIEMLEGTCNGITGADMLV